MTRRLAAAAVRMLVRCYPPEFRARYAAEVEENTLAVIQRARARGMRASIATTVRALLDLARGVIAERRVAQLREARRPSGRFGMGSLGQELRAAFRQSVRNPGFAGAVVLTLSLALGGLTAIFAIADPVLFRPLPYPEADRIVRLRAATERGIEDLFAADFARLLEDRGAFDAVATASLSLLGILEGPDDAPETVFLTGVTEGFFDVFRVEPAIGRRFVAGDPDDAVAVITHDFWLRHFNARPDIVGQPLVLRGSTPHTLEIVGVLPRDFVMVPEPRPVNLADDTFAGLTKASINTRLITNPNYRSAPFARLRPGATRDEALRTVGRAMAIVERSDPAFARVARKPALEPLEETVYPGARTPIFMLLSVAAFVVLLAFANLAHLFMAHFGGRAVELATRAAVGASRARLTRLLVVEAAVLTAAGAAGALLAGRVLKDAVVRMLPLSARYEALAAGQVDGRVVAVVVAVMVAGLAVFGVLPAAGAAGGDLYRRMQLSRAHGAGSRLRGGLVLAQTATAVAVLLTALLLAASFVRLAGQDLGFNPRGVQTLTIASPLNVGKDHERKRLRNLEIKRRIEALTGMPVALAGGIPGDSLPTAVGRADADRRAWRTIGYPVSAEFFAIFEIRLMRGRLMTVEEGLSGAPVIVIDERAAALSWPAQDPIGKAMRDSDGTVRTVIGVVRALQTRVIDDRFQRAAAFFPIPAEHQRAYTLLWRAPATVAVERRIRSEMRALDPQATALIEPLRVLEFQLEGPRFLAILLGALGALAIALTVVGLYGVVSHGVAQRTREMGIRIALGAEALGIARLVVMQTLKPAALGVALGLAVSLWWTETLRALLYGFTPHDWRVFLVSGAMVLALVVLACVLPVRRATSVDPLIALKSD